ncbi:MAG: Threonylcarbamoyladenosine tRNA methylthiotransferase MtaB [Chlamydiae bacterium]|nr:Threonylcarbamoyladenosine tRNA methylthiotransferase MtaB [Chlamydiota bacterium]
MSKKFKIETLGCRTNQYESLAYKSQLKQSGYEEAQGTEKADLCIVNTCTVTQSADSHSRNQIRRLRKKYPDAKIAVTGCMVEKGRHQLLEIEEADFVISNKEKDLLLNKIYPQDKFPEFIIDQVNSQTRAFIKIQDGCNSFCSYCIIPYVRGKSRSRTLLDIVNEAKTLVQSGIKEIVLTGINIGDFDGNDPSNSTRLVHLVQALDKIEGLKRIRISSIDPDEVDDELLETILTCDKTCASMHIVLQSGSNLVLKKMNRKYTRQLFFQTIDRIRLKCPDFTFTTDIIVGFPGERESDFEETMDVVSQVKFSKVHMFPYSRRERTKAASFTDTVPPQQIKERKNRLLEWSEKMSFELREKYVGRKMEVLTESNNSEEFMSVGHTDNFLKIYIPNKKIRANQLLQVIVTGNTTDGLIGKVLDEQDPN